MNEHALPAFSGATPTAHRLASGFSGKLWCKKLAGPGQDAPIVWKAVVDVNTEMTELMPWLLASRRPEDVISLPSPFVAWSRRVNDRRVLVIVNLVDRPSDLKLDLSAFQPTAVRDWVTGQLIPTEENTVSTRYPGYHVGIYEID